MTPIEVIASGIGALMFLMLAAYVVSYGWRIGEFHAVDRINSLLDRREQELENAQSLKFTPKRKE